MAHGVRQIHVLAGLKGLAVVCLALLFALAQRLVVPFFFKERPLFFGLAAPFIVVVSELLRDWYKFLRKIMILFPVMRFVGCHELVDSILLFI